MIEMIQYYENIEYNNAKGGRLFVVKFVLYRFITSKHGN